jgi:hypothetical protein
MRKRGNIKKIFQVGLIFIFLLLLGSSDISLAQSRLDVPTANMAIENAVPLSLINKIAEVKTKEVWGQGVLGEPIPLSDLDGNIVAYIFSFHIGGGGFPTYDEILAGIKEGRDLRNHVKNSRIEKAKEIYKTLKQKQGNRGNNIIPNNTAPTSDPRLGQIEPVRPDGSTSRRIQVAEIKEIEKFAAKKAIGAGEFGTIVVSATYDRVPVPVYMHYLAPYYTNFDLALEKAQQIIGHGAFLNRIYFLGIKGQYFEFVNNSNTILINAKTLEKKDLTKFQSSQGREEPNPQAMAKVKEHIEQNWAKIKSELDEK